MPVSPGTFSDDNIDNESTSEVGSAKYLDLKVSKWLSYKIVGLPKEVIHRSLSRVKIEQLMATYLCVAKRQSAAGAKVGVGGRHARS